MDTISAVAVLIVINLALSGDNAVVIGVAAQPLPPVQRRQAILIGSVVALVLRVVLTAVAALLLGLPGVRAVGGLLLLGIAFTLLEQTKEEADSSAGHVTLRRAVWTILIADLVMSLDNVLGVAAAANGNLGLLIFGIALSMALVAVGGSILATLIDRLWWLAYLGAAVVAWTGVEMLLRDELVLRSGVVPNGLDVLVAAAVTVATVGAAHYLHRVRPKRLGRPLVEKDA